MPPKTGFVPEKIKAQAPLGIGKAVRKGYTSFVTNFLTIKSRNGRNKHDADYRELGLKEWSSGQIKPLRPQSDRGGNRICLNTTVNALRKLLKVGSTITVIEGDHGSAYFYPDSESAHKAIQCQVKLQRRAGGNAMIGRELYPLLHKAGYSSIRVSPRMVYVDSSKPELVEGFTKRTFTAMIEGVRESAIKAGIADQPAFEKGIKDLYRTTEPDGVFCYTFFKAFAERK